MAAPGNFSAGGGEPRLSDAGLTIDYIRPQNRPAHDHRVTFEEYHYYANLTRAEEDALPPLETRGIRDIIFPPKAGPSAVSVSPREKTDDTPLEAGLDEKTPARRLSKAQHLPITDAEWTNASRAVRTATWAACFYLITTDILGPFSVP